MTVTYDWRGDIGDVWAEEWRRTDRTLAPVNGALVAEAAAGASALPKSFGAGKFHLLAGAARDAG